MHPGLPLLIPNWRQGLLELRPAIRNQPGLPLRHVAESRVIEQFAPAHVVVTRDGDIVHFSTRTGKYLESAPGAPTRNLVAMARRGLRLDLRTALGEAFESRRTIRRNGIRVELDDRIQVVDLIVEPLPDNNLRTTIPGGLLRCRRVARLRADAARFDRRALGLDRAPRK